MNAEIDAYLLEDSCEFASHDLGIEFDGVPTTRQGVETGVDNWGDLFLLQQVQCGAALMNVFTAHFYPRDSNMSLSSTMSISV